MLSVAKGYYNGAQVVVNPEDLKNLALGQEVLITYYTGLKAGEDRTQKRKAYLESMKSRERTGRTTEDIEADLKAARDDRF
ncbi:MAG: hypothetical protein VZQ80_10305 [Lachnospiraceae bacterium]|nr:hypothetical protein [Lachnospiraceae bacterium]